MNESEDAHSAPNPEAPVIDDLVRRILALPFYAEPYRGVSDCSAVQVPADRMLDLMTQLRGNPEFAFDFLASHSAVDRIDEARFEIVYYLYSLTHLHNLLVSVSVPRENPVVPTVCRIWKTAEWQEREVYDLFGVRYDNHPDLRRIFLEDDWEGYPLRKDYRDDFMLSRAQDEDAKS